MSMVVSQVERRDSSESRRRSVPPLTRIRRAPTVEQNYSETLIGIAELAVALAGFSGVAVAFGSRDQGAWHPGDRLRLNFLLESSLTAGGFALLTLVLLYLLAESESLAWAIGSLLWAIFMPWSLYSSHRRVRYNLETHGDIDRFANRVVLMVFAVLIVAQIMNFLWWRDFAPLLGALCFNLAGAAMQFVRLIRSVFHDRKENLE